MKVIPVFALILPGGVIASYSLKNVDLNQMILLQHRAMLFGILGVSAFILLARKLEDIAFYLLLASMLSFVLLVGFNTPVNHSLYNVFWIDLMLLMVIVACRLLLAMSNRYGYRRFS